MDVFKIAGRKYGVKIIDIEEGFEIRQSSNAGATLAEGALETLDPIGTYFNHRVTIARDKASVSEFDNLYNFVTTPRYDGVDVEIVHNQSTITYKAKFSTGSRKTSYIDIAGNVVYWDNFVLDIIPIKAQVIPE